MLCTKTAERLASFVQLVVPDQPPGRLRGNKAYWQDDDRPHPLQGEWGLLGPIRCPVVKTGRDTSDEKSAYVIVRIDVGGQVWPQDGWEELG